MSDHPDQCPNCGTLETEEIESYEGSKLTDRSWIRNMLCNHCGASYEVEYVFENKEITHEPQKA